MIQGDSYVSDGLKLPTSQTNIHQIIPKPHSRLGGGNSNIFYFHPYLGKWSRVTHMFQMGWNYQLAKQTYTKSYPNLIVD